MAPGDDTRPDNRPVSSFFDDEPAADETAVVRNPVPPPDRGPRRSSTDTVAGMAGLSGSDTPPYVQPPTPGRPPGGDAGLFDNPTDRSADGGRPTILANQASDWEENLQEIEVVRSGRTGLFLLFLLALLVVAVVALGLAARSVFGGGSDDVGTDSGDAVDATSTTLDTDSTVPPSTTSTTAFDPNQMRVTVAEDPFVCDSETREFALIAGADPNETIAFSSPQTEGLRSGTADANGELPIRWQCDPEQAGTTWELTAAGETSGRSVTFLFAGVTDSGDTAPGGTTTPATPTELTVDVIEDPFACDGEVRVFGGLSGAEPNEAVAFSSPQSPGLRPGMADAEGNLPIRWQCDPDQVGTTWELTATGETSGRTVTFTFTGG